MFRNPHALSGFAIAFVFLISVQLRSANAAIVTTADSTLSGTDSTQRHERIVSDPRLEAPRLFDVITNLPSDWYQYGKQTLRWQNAPIIAGCAALTAALIVVDRPTWLPFKHAYETSTPVERLADGFVFLGDGKFQFGLAGIFGAYGLFAPKSANADRALRTASQTCEVILACGAVVQLLKHVTGRESPVVATETNGAWRFFPNQIDYANHVPHYDAFPSGHLATATATLMVIANNYPEVTWLKPFGYVVLAGITTGLVATSIHWWSDFPLGFALGYGFGNLLSPSQDRVSTSTERSDLIGPTDSSKSFGSLLRHMELYPVMLQGATGVGMTLHF